jgi:hypothetical protein
MKTLSAPDGSARGARRDGRPLPRPPEHGPGGDLRRKHRAVAVKALPRREPHLRGGEQPDLTRARANTIRMRSSASRRVLCARARALPVNPLRRDSGCGSIRYGLSAGAHFSESAGAEKLASVTVRVSGFEVRTFADGPFPSTSHRAERQLPSSPDLQAREASKHATEGTSTAAFCESSGRIVRAVSPMNHPFDSKEDPSCSARSRRSHL